MLEAGHVLKLGATIPLGFPWLVTGGPMVSAGFTDEVGIESVHVGVLEVVARPGTHSCSCCSRFRRSISASPHIDMLLLVSLKLKSKTGKHLVPSE